MLYAFLNTILNRNELWSFQSSGDPKSMLYLIDLSSGGLKSIQNVLWSFQSSGCGLRRLFQLDVSLSLHLGPLSRSSLREYQIPAKVSPLTFGALEACSRMALNLSCHD